MYSYLNHYFYRRTLRVLFCLARGGFVVTERWLYACLENMSWIHPLNLQPHTNGNTSQELNTRGNITTTTSTSNNRSSNTNIKHDSATPLNYMHPRFGANYITNIDSSGSSSELNVYAYSNKCVYLAGLRVCLGSSYNSISTSNVKNGKIREPTKETITALVKCCGGCITTKTTNADVVVLSQEGN